MSLQDALDKLLDWAAGVEEFRERRREEAIVRKNEEALRRFEAMMGMTGVGIARG